MVEIVKDVGLITYGRGVFGQGARLLIWRSASGFFCPDDGHMEEEVQLKVQVEERIGETHGKEQGEEQRVKERTIAQRE